MGPLKIGEDAGVIWRVLDEQGDLSFAALKAETELSERDMSLALGWLAREGKIWMLKQGGKIMMGLTDK